jgi:hypothetical protein
MTIFPILGKNLIYQEDVCEKRFIPGPLRTIAGIFTISFHTPKTSPILPGGKPDGRFRDALRSVITRETA